MQCLFSFLVIGDVIATIDFLATNYTGDSTGEPAPPSSSPVMGTRPVPTEVFSRATAEALATARGDVINASPSETHGEKCVEGRLLDPLEIERRAITFTNDAREKAGLGPLSADAAIARIARPHSTNMERTGIFDHEIGGKDPTDGALAASYDCRGQDGSCGFAEDIAAEPRVWQWGGSGGRSSWTADRCYKNEEETALALVEGWMGSSGHRLNILDRQSYRIGVGVAVEETSTYGQVGKRFYAT